MIYLYDNAIVDDLVHSFNSNSVENPVIKVVGPEAVLGLAAQMHNDDIQYPVVALTRDTDAGTPDVGVTNFTRAHVGSAAVIDTETNLIYRERAVPIKLSYKLTVLTTTLADMDEIVRELMFKYLSMHFLTIMLPYECHRKVRFGVIIDQSSEISRSSGIQEYLSSGQLYQTIIPLKCEGCVYVHYTPAKLRRIETEEIVQM